MNDYIVSIMTNKARLKRISKFNNRAFSEGIFKDRSKSIEVDKHWLLLDLPSTPYPQKLHKVTENNKSEECKLTFSQPNASTELINQFYYDSELSKPKYTIQKSDNLSYLTLPTCQLSTCTISFKSNRTEEINNA